MTDPATPRARWAETWRLVGLPAPAALLEILETRYAERHRAYHDLRHVLACLELARSVQERLANAAAVELALWYHDAVYEPRAADNEEKSAELATAELASLDDATRAAVSKLVLATKHDAPPADPDAGFVVDIDLAVLGAPPEAFDRYEEEIRREYAWVPGPLFRRRRREILQGFLDRPRLYSTDFFRELLESPARANLARSIRRLA